MEESHEEILEKLGIVRSLRGIGIFGEVRRSTLPIDNRRYDQIGIDIREMVSLGDMANLEYQRENISPHIRSPLLEMPMGNTWDLRVVKEANAF